MHLIFLHSYTLIRKKLLFTVFKINRTFVVTMLKSRLVGGRRAGDARHVKGGTGNVGAVAFASLQSHYIAATAMHTK